MNDYREQVNRTLQAAVAAERAKDQQQQQSAAGRIDEAQAQQAGFLLDIKKTLPSDTEKRAFDLGVLAARQGKPAG